MPRKQAPRKGRKPAYWWNESISAECLKARMIAQRTKTRENANECRELYKAAKLALNREIKASKRACFNELCREADTNLWGSVYRIMMKKIRGPSMPQESCPEKLAVIVSGLFPQHEAVTWPTTPYEQEDEELPVTTEEIVSAVSKFKTNKAPGPDGIPNVVLKAIAQLNPEMLRSTMQKCMEEGRFPDRWKRQKLVLLPKPGKPPGDPSSFRPICLLDTLGKLLEVIIQNRLKIYTEGENGLSTRQFGFREGKSTVDAALMVTGKARKALEKKRRGDRFCGLITLDVKNAFNTANWIAIAEAMHRMRIPNYLCRMLKSYFENRVLVYSTEEGDKEYQVTAGVPQGSVLGPTLWNAMYNGVLEMQLPRGVEIVGFADDIILVATGKSRQEVDMLATEAFLAVENWMKAAKLQITPEKTEFVLVSNQRRLEEGLLAIGGHTIASKRHLRYLGVMLDDRLNYNDHIARSVKRQQ